MGTLIDRVVSGGFRITGGGGVRGNLATDNGGGQVEIVLSEAEGAERNMNWKALFARYAERVQKGIAYWDKQNHAVPAPNCMLKVRGEVIKDEGL